MKRMGVIAIVISGEKEVAMEMQNILSDFSDIIIGRMGVPIPEKHISVLSVIVSGECEKISALTGKLGRLNNVNVKSTLTSIIVED